MLAEGKGGAFGMLTAPSKRSGLVTGSEPRHAGRRSPPAGAPSRPCAVGRRRLAQRLSHGSFQESVEGHRDRGVWLASALTVTTRA
jgi:hypothetical protein